MRRLGSLLLVLSLAACPRETGETSPPAPLSRERGGQLVEVAAETFVVPHTWGFAVSRQADDSWSFELSARHPFNLHSAWCDRETGALGPLLRFEKAYIIGSAYKADGFPNGAPLQEPGRFYLDRRTFGPSEGTGCRPTYKINFARRGYLYAIQVAVHRTASDAVKGEVVDLLNSISR